MNRSLHYHNTARPNLLRLIHIDHHRAAGLYSGWRDPVQMDAETRQSAFAVWGLLIFWLNGIAFVLLGLQFPTLLTAVLAHYSLAQVLGFTAVIAGTAIVARLAWMFCGIYLPAMASGVCTKGARRASALVLGWAGMRGTVTLAGALSIPLLLPDGTPFPSRDIVIFLAFGVIAVTLLLQGTTLEPLIRRLGLREDQSRAQEDRMARITAVTAGLKALRALEPAATTPDHAAALAQVVSEYEHRLAVLDAESETRRSARRRRKASRDYRLAALLAERTAIDELWRGTKIADEVHRPLQQLLDYEESLLRNSPVPTDD